MSSFRNWQEIEAEHSAMDLFRYCVRVFGWRCAGDVPLGDAMRRFRTAVENRHRELLAPQDWQYLRRSLIRLMLRGDVPRSCPHFDLAMDRLAWLESYRTGPEHHSHPWAMTTSDRPSDPEDIGPEFDFVTGVGCRCDCVRRTAYAIVHDGTPSRAQLQICCLLAFDHGCGSASSLPPVTVGECHAADGGVMAIAGDLIKQTTKSGVPVLGPFLFLENSLVRMKVAA